MCRSPTMQDADVWGDDSPTDAGQLEREWQSRREGHYNAGFLEGLEVGKQESVQAGFDSGFMAGAEAGRAWGERAGALLSLSVLGASSGPEQAALESLVSRTTHAALAPLVVPTLVDSQEGSQSSELVALQTRVTAVLEARSPGA
ncbi:hypothetical protein ACKKBF_B12605 [Auxenochlorella protothecoides x Auxenochlorella symbiontica]